MEVQLDDGANPDFVKVMNIAKQKSVKITLKLRYFRHADQIDFCEILSG